MPETLTELCTCDDPGDDDCPRHARENELEAQLAEADNRRREGRMLLTQGMGNSFAVIRGGDLDRLSRWCEKVDDYLRRTSDPRDILRGRPDPARNEAPGETTKNT